MMPFAKTLILCDFDGTATPVDVGNRLLDRFTGDGWEEIDRDYCAGRIGSRAAYGKIAPLLRGTREDMLEYALAVASLDRNFEAFYRRCRQEGIDIKIVSDGLDFYIEALLVRQGLSQLEYHANCAVFEGGNRVSFAFPGVSEDCGRCGNCKRAILEQCRPSYQRIIYIGDGHSDICPARRADLVFAKTLLYEKYAHDSSRCISFETFADIIGFLEDRGILAKKAVSQSAESLRGVFS